MALTEHDKKIKFLKKASEKAFKEGFKSNNKDLNPYPTNPLVEDQNFLCYISYNTGCDSRGNLNGLINSHVIRLLP